MKKYIKIIFAYLILTQLGVHDISSMELEYEAGRKRASSPVANPVVLSFSREPSFKRRRSAKQPDVTKSPGSRENALIVDDLIIAPIFPEDIGFISHMLQGDSKDGNGDPYRGSTKEEKEESSWGEETQEFENKIKEREFYKQLNSQDKGRLKLTDYAIFKDGQIIGLYRFHRGGIFTRKKADRIFTDIYLHPNHRARGYGFKILEAMTTRCIEPCLNKSFSIIERSDSPAAGYEIKDLGKLKYIYALILDDNIGSRKIHEKCGWRSYEDDVQRSEIIYDIYQYPARLAEDEELDASGVEYKEGDIMMSDRYAYAISVASSFEERVWSSLEEVEILKRGGELLKETWSFLNIPQAQKEEVEKALRIIVGSSPSQTLDQLLKTSLGLK